MKKNHIILTIIIIVIVIVLGYLLLQIPVGAPKSESGDIVKATATVYVKDPAQGEFNIWNGQAFGQSNPFQVTNGLSVILPTGEYYVNVQAEGYDSINSLIVSVQEQSIVTADINLGRKNKLWEKAVATLSPADSSNNFALNVTPLPQQNLLRIGEYLPPITAYDADGNQKVFLNETYDKPVIVYVFSTWNTEAQEQMDIFKSVVSQLEDKYLFIPISTMEPEAINSTKINRGEYAIDFYKPAEGFFDDYMIISLPQFFIANNRGELLGIINGSRSANELVTSINEIANQ